MDTTSTAATRPLVDTDTKAKGVDGPYSDWEMDHTGLVHILWAAKHAGLTLEGDADKIASMVMRSRWLAANRSHTWPN
jgi:hypothetical protein